MKEFYNQAFQTSLHEIKNDETGVAPRGLKGFMRIIFVLSLLSLVLLAFAKAQGV